MVLMPSDIYERYINPFHATRLFLYHLKTSKHQKTRRFRMFSEGIERDQWHEMGEIHPV